jgi:polar amino acid transport system substrate-binding protein
MITARRALPPVTGILLAAFVLSACAGSTTPAASSGSDSDSAAPDGVTVIEGGADGATAFEVATDDDLAERAAALITDGTLELATKAAAPPYEFFEDGTDTLRGSDIDLGYAIAAKLGLEATFSSMEFPGILPAIQAKRYDFSIAGMGDTPARQEVVDFVDYSTDSNSIVTTKGNPKKIEGIDTLCGLNISSVEGSVYLGLLEKQNESCDDKMNITVFQDNPSALLQVQTGRADATMYQTGVALYLIKTDEASKNLEVIDSEEYGKGYNAIAFNKENTELRDLVRDALVALQDDGVYEEIHVAWGLTSNMVDEITINDGLRFNQPS